MWACGHVCVRARARAHIQPQTVVCKTRYFILLLFRTIVFFLLSHFRYQNLYHLAD